MVACPLIISTGVSILAARIDRKIWSAVAVGERDVEEAEVVACAS